ncbi:MAG: type II toxin-antitoxin system RelE/ParE family toxin [Clostridiales Family XIII bacterium]|nr:type II toxin-antitoxin system RelE/ParE family toxin [Clostridiales Family XIII bacterium]
MKKYTVRYLPLFDADLSEAWDYIAHRLNNPNAADRLVADAEAAILERLKAPASFEKYQSAKEREYSYYRIYVHNFTVWYVVTGNVMEVRRFLYNRRNTDELL